MSAFSFMTASPAVSMPDSLDHANELYNTLSDLCSGKFKRDMNSCHACHMIARLQHRLKRACAGLRRSEAACTCNLMVFEAVSSSLCRIYRALPGKYNDGEKLSSSDAQRKDGHAVMGNDPSGANAALLKGYVDSARPIADMFSAKGKVALVTGGTSGLGFNVALRLLQGGANVVVSSYSESEAEIAMPLLEEAGFKGKAKFFKADVTDEDGVAALIQFVSNAFGSLDIYVNSAAVWNYAHIYDMPLADFRKVIDVNVTGAFLAVKHVSKYMIEHEIKGKITLISSNVAWMPYPVFGGYPHYAASKGGLVSLTIEAAKELKRFGIMVNTVAPGAMVTPGSSNTFCSDGITEEQADEFYDELSVWQTDGIDPVDNVAIVVYAMCTPMSDSMTGECVVVDGGMSHNIVKFQPEIMQYPE
jgi:NAD(P)-dependent dehydrogenase (short-subunit alcohol dehydrogenase family)